MDFGVLTDKNLMMFALKHYDNVQSNSMEEFQSDFRIPKYLKRLFNKFEETGDLKERLILNHLIIFFNVFGHEPATRMLFYKVSQKHWSYLKTFLVYLNRCPDIVNGKRIVDVPLDQKIVTQLRKIRNEVI